MGLSNDWRRFTLCRRTSAVMLVILGLFPMIGGFFATIPRQFSGGAMTSCFSMIAIAGFASSSPTVEAP
ncbi:solute carrier family 23 protein [Shigella flexneri]